MSLILPIPERMKVLWRMLNDLKRRCIESRKRYLKTDIKNIPL